MPCLRQGALAASLWALLSLLLTAGTVAAQPSIVDARIGNHPDMTRVVLELDEGSSWRVFTLSNPYRVVIDLEEVKWPDRPEEMAGGYVSALRYGLFTPGTSRVVLDLDRPASVRDVIELPPQDGRDHRLVVDLEPADASAFSNGDIGQVQESARPLPPIDIALPSAPKAPQDSRPTIVIDAGHGGVDPGAIGTSGLHEKALVLEYAKALRDALAASGRYRVVMTRDDDRFIPLRQRFAMAEQANGDLFISMHANTHASSSIRGASVYTLSEDASDAEAAAIAAKENRADAVGGLNLANQPEEVSQILLGLAQRDTMNMSKTYAGLLVEELGKRVDLLRNTHRFAGFAVLKSPTVPSVLVEIGYLSNPQEERRMQDAGHRQKFVQGLVEALRRHFEVQQAWNR